MNEIEENLFGCIKDANLRLAVIDNLWREKIIPLSTEDICTKIGPDINKDGDEPIDEIEAFLMEMNIADEHLLQLQTFIWETDSAVSRVIWPTWDGKDHYFHVESIKGIEVLKNLKSISGNLFAINDLAPLPLLCRLKTIDIANELFYEASPEMKLRPLLDILDLKNLTINAEPVAENIKAEKALLEEIPNVNIRWEEADSEFKAKRLYYQITCTMPADERLELLSSAIALNQNNYTYFRDRAKIYLKDLKDPEKALIEINRSIELCCDTNDYAGFNYSLRAEIYEAMKEYEKAVSDYSKVIALQPDSDVTWEIWKQTQIYRVLKEYKKAIPGYLSHLKNNFESSNYKNYIELLEIYICVHEYEEALLLLKDYPLYSETVHEKKKSYFEGIFSLLQYIIHLHTDRAKNLELNRLKALGRQWEWDYSHLELWVQGNGLPKKDNEVIREMIAHLKGNHE